MDMSIKEKKEFLENVDLEVADFEIKISDFGFSKLLVQKDNTM